METSLKSTSQRELQAMRRLSALQVGERLPNELVKELQYPLLRSGLMAAQVARTHVLQACESPRKARASLISPHSTALTSCLGKSSH